jgi:DNA-binding Xre family transcriptional regulator
VYAHQGERFPIMGKMTISFRKLRRLLKTNNIQMQQLKQITGLSNNVISKIRKDGNMQLDKLDLICECLEVMLNRKIDFCDVVERVSDHESERVEEI